MPLPPNIDQLARAICMVRDVDIVPRGHLRIETKFIYPDRSSIDVFVLNPVQTTLGPANPILSDLGQTTAWLADVQVKPWQSKKRQRFLDDALYTLGVRQNGGALETEFAPTHDALEDAVIRLGQACSRVADLSFTRRSSMQSTTTDEVEELIADADLPYITNAPLQGRRGNLVVVDFLVEGRRTQSAVITLAALSSNSAHVAANEVFRKHYDLDTPTRGEQRVTIFDDSHGDVYRPEDLERIREVSDLLPLSQRRDVVALLAA
jgi:hypothetical protein